MPRKTILGFCFFLALSLTLGPWIIEDAAGQTEHGGSSSHSKTTSSSSAAKTSSSHDQKTEDSHEEKGDMNPPPEVQNLQGFTVEPQIPSRLQKGQTVSLSLGVKKDNLPVEGLQPVLMVETIGGGHGTGHEEEETGGEHDANALEEGGILGEGGPAGEYRFSWTPDTDGQVNLVFHVEDSRFSVPVKVDGPPPNPYVLGSFGLFVLGTLSWSTYLRQRDKKEGRKA